MIVEDFLTWMAAEGRSENSIAAYRNDLAGFEPTPAGVRRYADAVAAAGYSEATRQRKRASARSFCRWLEARGVGPLGLGDWRAVLDHGKTGAPLAPPPDTDARDLERLLAGVIGFNRLERRDRALLRLLVETGCRISEAVGMDEGDVDLKSNYVLFRRDDRQVPISEQLASDLAAYLRAGRPLLAARSATPALFVNDRGQRLSRQGAWLVLQWRARAAGVEALSPAKIRHAAAYRLSADATDAHDAAYLLGQNVNTTLRYRAAARRRAA